MNLLEDWTSLSCLIIYPESTVTFCGYKQYKFYDQLYFINKTQQQKMEKAGYQRIVFYDKENDFKKGNKNYEMGIGHIHKTYQHEKLYQSVTNTIQLRPAFLKRKLLSNTGQFCSLYGEQLLKNEANLQISPRFLGKHEIDSSLRSKMIDWMTEVTTSYKFTNKTFFDGIQIMDRYFQAENECLHPTQLHIIGVQSMFIASKMNEVYPLRIRTVFQKIGHRKLTMESLVGMQEKIIKKLEYKLNSWTIFDLAMLKLSEYYAYEQQEKDAMMELFPFNHEETASSDSRLKRMQDLCCFICRHIVFQYDFSSENSMIVIAQSCVRAVLEIMDVSSIPSCFYSSTSINLKITKQKIYKIMKNFKSSYCNLNNLFKFTPSEVIDQVAKFGWN